MRPGASAREEAWGKDSGNAAHKGVKVLAERKTRRELCSKWQPPSPADSGQA